jgi:putative SOS response-associated peptidase YedK
MPVILENKAIDHWLNKELTDKYYLHTLLNTYDPDEMKISPVTLPESGLKKSNYDEESLWNGDLLLKP